MADIETRLIETLGSLREDAATRAPAPGAWARIEGHGSRPPGNRRFVVAGLAAVTAVLVVATALVFPNRNKPTTIGSLAGAEELVYVSYTYEGSVVRSGRLLARDLRTGNERLLASGRPSCGVGPLVDPSRRRIAFCADGQTWILDVRSGRKVRVPLERAQLEPVPDRKVGVHISWMPEGALLFLDTGAGTEDQGTIGPVGRLFTYENGEFSLVYTIDRYLYEPVMALQGGVYVTSQCVTETCTPAGSNELVTNNNDGVLHREQGASAIGAFDEARQVLYQRRDGDNQRLTILDLTSGRAVVRPTQIRGAFSQLAERVDGSIALVGTANGDPRVGVHLLDRDTLALQRAVWGGGPIAWTPDGALIFSDEDLRTIRLTDLEGHSRVLVRGRDVRVLTVRAGRSTPSGAQQNASTSLYDDCPVETPLPPGPSARSEAIAATRRSVPDVYENPNVPEALDTTGYRITRAYDADPNEGFGSIAHRQCGEVVGSRTWVVELYFPAEEPSASVSNGQVFVSRFRSGWRVWHRYH